MNEWFAGRHEAIAEADRVLRSSDGRPALLTVTGEAGIGKSALLGVICDRARTAEVFVVRSRAYEGADLPPLGVHAAWVRELIVALRAERPELAKRIEAFESVGLALLSPSYVSSEAEQRALELPYHEQSAAISSLTARLVDALERPLLVAIDDLHRADEQSIEALVRLLDHEIATPITIAATMRPTRAGLAPALDRLLDLAVAEHLMTQVTLEPLSVDEIAEYLALSGRSAGEQSAAGLADETRGHPLLLRWMTENDGATVPLFVRSRMGRLEEHERRVLELLALYGFGFTSDLIADLAGVGDHEARVIAQKCVGLLLLTETDAGRYEFLHDLLRDEVVSLIDDAKLPRHHARIGHVLSQGEHLPADWRDRRIATHLLRSSVEIDLRAGINHAIAAARSAEQRGAWSDALAIWKDASIAPDSLTDELTRADIQLGIARAVIFSPVRYPERYEAIPNLHQAIRAYIELGAIDRLVEVARLHRATVEPEYATLFRKALSIVPEDHPGRAIIEYRTATCLYFLNDLEGVAELMGSAHQRAGEGGPAWLELYALTELGLVAASEGRYDRALAICDEVASRSAGLGDPWLMFRPLIVRHIALTRLGRAEEAEAAARSSLRVLEKTRGLDANLAYMAQTNLQRSALARGEWEEVLSHDTFKTAMTYTPCIIALCETGLIEEADAYLERLIPGISNDPTAWFVVALMCTYCVGVRARTTGDRRFVRDAVEWAHAIPARFRDYPFFNTILTVALARISHATGDSSVARFADEILGHLRRNPVRAFITDIPDHQVTEAEAMIELALRSPGRAQAGFERALEMATHVRDLPAQAWLHAELVSVLERQDNRSEAERHQRHALSIARSLGMRALERHIAAGPTEVDRLRSLTAREREVLELVAAGKANKEIAADLGISIYTAGNHIRHILQKLGCANRAEAVAIAGGEEPW